MADPKEKTVAEKLAINAGLINLLGFLATVIGMIVGGTLWASDIRAEVRIKAAEHDARLVALESKMSRVADDHDIIIEIHTELRQLRSILERNGSAIKAR